MTNNYFDEVHSIENEIIAARRQLHMYPELEFDLPRTCELVENKLTEYGIKVYKNYGKSSIVGILEGKSSDKVIALRADMDALPIQEKNEVEYKSKIDGQMHACGHDAHTAMLLGAAKILAKHKNEINGTIKFIFQASEEGTESGAKLMVEDNVMDDVDAIYSMHVFPLLNSGTVGIVKDKAFASTDEFIIEFTGIGGHSSMPHTAINPVSLACKFVNDIQYLKNNKLDATEPCVLTVCSIHGGEVHNVIPEKVKLIGNVRAYSNETRKSIEHELDKAAKSVCESLGGTYNCNYISGIPFMINDDTQVEFAKIAASNVVGEENVYILNETGMGSEDFAFYLEKSPGIMIILGTGSKNNGTFTSPHNPKFNIDENSLVIGSKLFIQYVLDFFNM